MALWKNLVYAMRRLRSRPGFLAIAILTLSLGIGVNAAIFTFVNGLLLRPLPVAEPSRLATLAFNQAGMSQSTSFPAYLDIRNRNQVFSSIAAIRAMPMALSLSNKSDRIWGYLVTGNYFETLGISPARGRFLTPEDDGASPTPVAVISYATWQSRFAADPQIVGRSVKINGEKFTTVGVTPRGFIGTERFYASEIWVPFSVIRIIEGRDWRTSRGTQNAWTVARFKPGVTHAGAEASLAVLASQMRRENPIGNDNFAIHLAPVGLLGNFLRNATVGITGALMVVGLLTLVVACTNLAGLILAQAADRRKEMAIRLAIGASRGALARMMLLESLLVGLAGGVGGLVAAAWASAAIQSWIPSSGLPLAKFTTDWRVVVFGAGAALLTAMLSGLVPSLRAAAVDVAPALKSGSATGIRGWHLRDVYLGIQVTVCMVLLAASVSTIRALQNTLAMHFGFDPDHAVMLRADLAMSQYTPKQGIEFDRRLIQRIRAIPGIEAAGIANSVPFSIDQSNWDFRAEGRPVSGEAALPTASVYQSGPGYMRAAGTRLLAGRDFDERDREGSPKVVIVNETLVKNYMPPGDPIGKRIGSGHSGDWMQIVGVVEAGKYQNISEDPMPAFWMPLEQSYNSAATVVIRSRRPEGDVLGDARRIVAELNPDVPIFEAQRLSDVINFPMAPLRMTTGALTIMGGLAALLCALGLYGLLAYSVLRRTREIGIRVALGARSRNALGSVLSRTMLLVGASGAVGIVFSIFALRILARFLSASTDPQVYLPVVALLAAITLVACAIPARRALRIHPSDALRQE